jgi:hypothetical protein
MALRPSARFYGDEDSEGVGSAPAEEYPNPDPEAYLLVELDEDGAAILD